MKKKAFFKLKEIYKLITLVNKHVKTTIKTP